MVRNPLETSVFAFAAFFASVLWAESLESAAPRTIDFGSGLRAEVLAEGTGEECRRGDRLTVHYTGWLERSEKRISDPFDDSRNRGEPLSFVLGAGETIKGWDVGLVGMKTGERRLLHVPPAYGYGSQDLGVIPPNSTLRFEVELVSREAGLEPDTLFDQKKVQWVQNVPGVEIFDQKTGLGDEAKDGVARLADRASNSLALAGGRTTVVMPDIVPGKARDLMLRVTATGDNELAFAGAEAFEGDEGALEPPNDGETVVYFFTESAGDVMLVARKRVERIENE